MGGICVALHRSASLCVALRRSASLCVALRRSAPLCVALRGALLHLRVHVTPAPRARRNPDMRKDRSNFASPGSRGENNDKRGHLCLPTLPHPWPGVQSHHRPVIESQRPFLFVTAS